MYDLLSSILIKEYNAREVVNGTNWGALQLEKRSNWREVMEKGESAIFHVELDTGWVWCNLYCYRGVLYVFVPKNEDKPGAIEVLEDGIRAHHGVYFGMVV